MFTIGEFARAGRVSVRMLRHYDAIGLLHPARVDDATGYRYYDVDQLRVLNQVVALKDLGFTLQEVGRFVADDVDTGHLRRMLEARRAGLREQICADTARLAGVDARLRSIESEAVMISTTDITLTRIPSVRVAELRAPAAGWEPASIGPVVQPLCMDLFTRLEKAGVEPVGELIAHYTPADDGSVIVHAALPVSVEPDEGYGFAVVDLPEVTAATALHHGSMDSCLVTYQAIERWIDANGHTGSGVSREVYRIYGEGDPDTWITELQMPVAD